VYTPATVRRHIAGRFGHGNDGTPASFLLAKISNTMPKSKRLSANMEDYLETIYHIVSEKKAARAKDIAVRMAVNSASVTGALRLLGEKGHINYAPYDVITLTPSGETLARDIVRRHEILKDFFTKVLDVDEQEAEDTACKMEHAVSPVIIDRLVRFVEFVQICPRGGEEWIGGFRQFCEKDDALSGCENSISKCLDDLKNDNVSFSRPVARRSRWKASNRASRPPDPCQRQRYHR
jgi:DtxR family Mn-dependent transcriptional regulator